MKRRWNYKIPRAPCKIFWAPTFLVGPSKICMSKRIYQLFSENINKLITKENSAGRCDSLIVIIHNVQNSKFSWNVRSGQNNRLFGSQNAYGRIGGPRKVRSGAFRPTLTPGQTDRERNLYSLLSCKPSFFFLLSLPVFLVAGLRGGIRHVALSQ